MLLLQFTFLCGFHKSYKGHLKTIEIRPLFEPSMKNRHIPIHLV